MELIYTALLLGLELNVLGKGHACHSCANVPVTSDSWRGHMVRKRFSPLVRSRPDGVI